MTSLARSDSFSGATRRDARLSLVSEVHDLQSKIKQLEKSELGTRILPTFPGLGRLLPRGGLQRGASYAVSNSTTLAMAMLAGPSAAGTWCAVLGMPDFGVEAAVQLGLDLERLVFVPEPGEQWLAVAAALIDVVGVLLLRAPSPVSSGQSARLSARIRQRGCVVVSAGSWPQAEAELHLAGERWDGLGEGHGLLHGRAITVAAHWRNGQVRHGELRTAGSQAPSRRSNAQRSPAAAEQPGPEQMELKIMVSA